MPDDRVILPNDELDLFRFDFNHDDQIRLCARHLEVMREEMGSGWWTRNPGEPVDGKRSKRWAPQGAWTREHNQMAGHFVRHASESADFPATVDFITRKTLLAIRSSRAEFPNRSSFHLKQWKAFTHEHMVPGSAVLKILTDPAFPPNRERLYKLLAALSFRALVTGTKRTSEVGAETGEISALDTRFRSQLPEPKDVPGLPAALTLEDISPDYYALMRYDAAGLIDELIAVTARAKTALESYRGFKASVKS